MRFRKMEWHRETQKKNLRKESWQRTSGTTKWDKLGQVGIVGQVGQGEGRLQILVGQVEQGEGGLQILVGQVGQGRSWWDKWDKDKGSVHLNHSTQYSIGSEAAGGICAPNRPKHLIIRCIYFGWKNH